MQTRLSRPVLGAVLLSLCLTPREAFAQARTQAAFLNSMEEVLWGDVCPVPGQEETSGSFVINPRREPRLAATADFMASARGGILHVGFSRWATTGPPDYFDWFHTLIRTEAYWDDKLIFDPISPALTPAYIDLTARVTGRVSGHVSGGLHSFAGAGSNFSVDLQELRPHWLEEGGRATARTDDLSPGSFNQSFDRVWTVRKPFQQILDVELGILAGDHFYLYGQDESGYVTASGATRLEQTAGLTGITVYDASGVDITSQMSYRFANGLTFYAPASTVPEPVTLAMLAPALLGLALLRRRRKG